MGAYIVLRKSSPSLGHLERKALIPGIPREWFNPSI
jgi:hypothetical protein